MQQPEDETWTCPKCGFSVTSWKGCAKPLRHKCKYQEHQDNEHERDDKEQRELLEAYIKAQGDSDC